MMARPTERSPNFYARVAGALYLLLIAFNAFDVVYVLERLIVPGDAATTARNIMASGSLFRMGLVSHLFGILCLLLVTLPLYSLFRPVNRDLAALMALFVWVSIPILAINMFNHFIALPLLSGADYLTAFTADQLYAQVMLSLNLYDIGYHVAQFFFSLYLLPLGYLVNTSGFFPRVLGIVLMISCFAYLIDVFLFFLLPSYEGVFLTVLGVFSLTELVFGVWLLVKGVKIHKE
jgi:hypothetical protein